MIRQALSTDAAAIARLIVMAMGDLAGKFIGESDPNRAIPVFERFASLEANQYSYENTLVYEDEAGICGSITAYPGGDLEVLRQPFLAYISAEYDIILYPEAETGPGEYYIDCLAVFDEQQGKGIGKKLISALVEKATTLNYQKVGLIVSYDNLEVEKLYSKLGFKVVRTIRFMGGDYLHMQYHPSYPL